MSGETPLRRGAETRSAGLPAVAGDGAGSHMREAEDDVT